MPIGLYLLGHPDVERFYADHGIDVRSAPFWTLEFCRPRTGTVASTDPLRLRVETTCDGERLTVTVAQDGSIERIDRS